MLGKDAIIPNLPYPPVILLKDHSYIPLGEIIADALGQGVPIEAIFATAPESGVVSRIGETKKAREILAKATKLHPGTGAKAIFLIEWQDDFQHLSFNKANRDGVWIKVVTIVPPPGTKKRLSTEHLSVRNGAERSLSRGGRITFSL